jgi:hypothetical protein
LLKTGLVSRDSRNRNLTSLHKEGQKNRLAGCRGLPLALAVAVLGLIPLRGSAQRNSNAATVSLSATMNSAITVTAAPGSVNVALLQSGVSTASSPVSITTAWAIPRFFGTITEYAYFTSPATALTDGAGYNIPSANVSGSFNAGAYTAFTGASPFAAGSSMTLFTTSFFFFFFNNPATRTDSLNLQINTTGLNLPAGTYTGVLHIQAQVI